MVILTIRIKPSEPPSANPFGRGHPRRIGRIQRYHAVGGANGTTMVVIIVDCCVGGRVFRSRQNPYRGIAVKERGNLYVPFLKLYISYFSQIHMYPIDMNSYALVYILLK